jgi:hypothetical protein
MRKVILSMVASVLFMMGWQSTASANIHINGYVCSTRYTAQPNSLYGMDGYVRTSISTQPYCQGSTVDIVYHQSNNGNCTGYEFSEAERIGVFQVLKNAAENGLKVKFYTTDEGCVYYTEVYGY